MGLTYLVGISETNKGTVVDELQERWSSSYDIVVRPKGARSGSEKENLLDPNYLSNLTDGISLKQYETIKCISNVKVAAPISMIGYTSYSFDIMPPCPDTGIFRISEKYDDQSEILDKVISSHKYKACGDWFAPEENFFSDKAPNYYLSYTNYEGVNLGNNMVDDRSILLAAIDPEQEAKLVGLDEAIADQQTSRYFNKKDAAKKLPMPEEEERSHEDVPEYAIPIIMNNQAFVDRNKTRSEEHTSEL